MTELITASFGRNGRGRPKQHEPDEPEFTGMIVYARDESGEKLSWREIASIVGKMFDRHLSHVGAEKQYLRWKAWYHNQSCDDWSRFPNVAALVKMLTGDEAYYTGNCTTAELAAADKALGDMPFKDVAQYVRTGHVDGFEAVETILQALGLTESYPVDPAAG
jgi:hypothetical protein